MYRYFWLSMLVPSFFMCSSTHVLLLSMVQQQQANLMLLLCSKFTCFKLIFVYLCINSIGYCGMLRSCLVGSVECRSTSLPSGRWQVKSPTRPPIRLFKKLARLWWLWIIIVRSCLSSDDYAIMQLDVKAIGSISFILPQLLKCRKRSTCFLERVRDVDASGVVYLSFGIWGRRTITDRTTVTGFLLLGLLCQVLECSLNFF